MNEGTLFLLLWFGVIFLFFSAASSKGDAYLLPLFPAASLLVGNLWRELFEAPTPWLHRGFIYCFLLLVLTFAGGLVYSMVDPPIIVQERYGVDVTKISLFSSILVVIIGLSFVALWKKHYRVCFGVTSGLVVSAVLVFIVRVVPLMNPYRSTIELAHKFDAMAASGEKMVFFHGIKDSALFYADRKAIHISDDRELIEYLRSNPRALVFLPKTDFERVKSLTDISYVIESEGNELLVASRK